MSQDAPFTVRRVTVAFTRKVSRNYNSTEFHVGLEADLAPGADPEAVARDLTTECIGLVRQSFAALKAETEGGKG